MADVVSTAPCPGRVELAVGPLGRPRREPLPLLAAAAPDSNALAAAKVGGASPEAIPTDPRSDAAVGGATTTVGGATAGRLLLLVVVEEVGVAVGGGVCFFDRMRSSIASLLVLGRGNCGVGEELFSSADGWDDGLSPSSSAVTVSESVVSPASRSAINIIWTENHSHGYIEKLTFNLVRCTKHIDHIKFTRFFFGFSILILRGCGFRGDISYTSCGSVAHSTGCHGSSRGRRRGGGC